MSKKHKNRDDSLNDVRVQPGFSNNPGKPENQNQQHNVKKQALGPNTER